MPKQWNLEACENLIINVVALAYRDYKLGYKRKLQGRLSEIGAREMSRAESFILSGACDGLCGMDGRDMLEIAEREAREELKGKHSRRCRLSARKENDA